MNLGPLVTYRYRKSSVPLFGCAHMLNHVKVAPHRAPPAPPTFLNLAHPRPPLPDEITVCTTLLSPRSMYGRTAAGTHSSVEKAATALVRRAREHMNNEEAQTAILRALTYLAGRNAAAVAAAGGLATAIHIMVALPERRDIQQAGCNLAARPGCAKALVAVDGARAVIAAMCAHADDPVLQARACNALAGAAAIGRPAARGIVEVGGVEALRLVMAAHPESAAVQRSAFHAVRALAVAPPLPKSVATAIVSLIADAMRWHASMVPLQEEASETIAKLGEHGGAASRLSAVSGGGLAAVLTTLRARSAATAASTTTACIRALSSVAAGRGTLSASDLECKRAVIAAGAVDQLLAVMRGEREPRATINESTSEHARPPMGPRSPSKGVEARGWIVGDGRRLRVGACELPLPTTVEVEAMRARREPVRAACHCVCNLAAGDAECRQHLIDAGLVEALLMAMRVDLGDAALLAEACEALRHLCNANAQWLLDVGGGVATIVEAMRCHEGHEAIEADAYRVLWQVGSLGVAGKRAIAAAGGLLAMARGREGLDGWRELFARNESRAVLDVRELHRRALLRPYSAPERLRPPRRGGPRQGQVATGSVELRSTSVPCPRQ